MGTSIPTWRTPRLKYAVTEGVTADDFERIEGNMLNLRNTGRPYGDAVGDGDYSVTIVDVPMCEDFVSIGVRFTNTNKKAKPTLDMNSQGKVEIIKSDGSAFGPAEIVPNIWYLVIYAKDKWQALGTLKASYPFGNTKTVEDQKYTAIVPGVGELTVGQMITVLFREACGGQATLNVNKLGEVPIRRYDGQILQPREIRAGVVLNLIYVNDCWMLTAPMQYIPLNTTDEIFTEIFHGVRTSGDDVYTVSVDTLVLRPMRTKLAVRFHRANQGPVHLKVNTFPAVEVRTMEGEQLAPETIADEEIHLLIFNGEYFIDLTPFGMYKKLRQRTIDLATTQIKLINDVAALMGSQSHGNFAGILNIHFDDIEGIKVTGGTINKTAAILTL